MFCAQNGILSVTGAAIGLGTDLTSWSPWLCLLPSNRFSVIVWAQIGVGVSLVPLAALAALVSRPLADRIWKSKPTRMFAYNAD